MPYSFNLMRSYLCVNHHMHVKFNIHKHINWFNIHKHVNWSIELFNCVFKNFTLLGKL